MKAGDLKFYSSVGFHDISRLAKYSFTKDFVDYFYYDNEDNMPVSDEPKKVRSQHDMNLANVKNILSKGSNKGGLDYAYTTLCLLFDIINPKNKIESVGIETKIFELLIKN